MNRTDYLRDLFFKDLKSYNGTNFRTLLKVDLTTSLKDAVVCKAFSSIVTRYFIFREKHVSEFTDSEFNMLYFQLKIDLISRYFSEYPESDISILTSFQDQIRDYSERVRND